MFLEVTQIKKKISTDASDNKKKPKRYLPFNEIIKFSLQFANMPDYISILLAINIEIFIKILFIYVYI